MERIRRIVLPPRTRGPAVAAFAVDARTSAWVHGFGLALAVAALALLFAAPPAHAQFGSTATYNFRVVDQAGRALDGSLVRIEGATGDMSTPATVDLAPGPQLVVIEPAVLGPMLPGGAMRPGGLNGLSRNEFLFLDPGGGDVVIEWRTAEVAVSVVDQGGVVIPGASWGFAGDGAALAPGTLVLPLTDEGLYPGLAGPSVDGWRFDIRAAFEGAAIDLVRGEQREAVEGLAALAFEWRQAACTMGVVDAAGVAIRGATWTILGRTFAAGDAIALPATDEALYADLQGAMATGFDARLSTNTSFGDGDARFEVTAGGALSPDFVDVNGGQFGLRCGVTAFPPVTTGTLLVRVEADGAPFPGAQVTVVAPDGATSAHTTGLDGSFQFADVPEGTASLQLAVPAGYHAVEPASGSQPASVSAGATTEVRFAIAADATPPALANSPEPWNYWRREVQAARRGHGRRDESAADMATNFPEAIFAGFARHATDPVRVEGVTLVDPDGDGPAAARRLTLADMDATLDPGGNDARRAARRELLVVLLNVVSGRLSLGLVVDAAGTTLEQEIRRLAAMIDDGQAANDGLARSAAERINRGQAGRAAPAYHTTGGAVGSLPAELAGPMALRAGAVPGQAGVRLAFTLDAAQRVTLDVYDVSGRRQARLYEGEAPAGTSEVTWSPRTGRPGVYFARLTGVTGVRTAKVIASR